MACIISFSTSQYVVQVSDRQPSGQGDEASNAVVFIGADGVVSIGYTGAACVGRAPTDQWLAELLWGGRVRRGFGARGQAATDRVADAVQRIRRALDGTVDAGLEILISGFRLKADRWLPVNIRMSRRPDRPARVLRRLRLGAHHVVAAAVGSPPTLAELAMALERRAGRGGGFMTANGTAEMLAGLARTVACRDQDVGVDLLTTIIRPPAAGPVICRFSSLHYAAGIALGTPDFLSLKTPKLVPLGVAECLPWIVGRQTAVGSAPFFGNSGLTLQADGYTILIESGRPEPLTAKWRARPVQSTQSVPVLPENA